MVRRAAVIVHRSSNIFARVPLPGAFMQDRVRRTPSDTAEASRSAPDALPLASAGSRLADTSSAT